MLANDDDDDDKPTAPVERNPEPEEDKKAPEGRQQSISEEDHVIYVHNMETTR